MTKTRTNSKESFPMEVAINTVAGAFMGACFGAPFQITCSPSKGYKLDAKKLSRLGEYRPLIVSLVVAEHVRNFAIVFGVHSGITCVMEKLRGKDDLRTSMVAGFGSGVALSLATGMRGPKITTVGALFALLSAWNFKILEKIEHRRLAKEKKRGMFSSIIPWR